MRKKLLYLFIVTVMLLTMTAFPVFANDSAADKKVVESNPEFTVPLARTAGSKLLKTAAVPVKLDSEQVGLASEIIFEKSGKGIYFLKKISYSKYELLFYDLDTQEYKTVYSSSGSSTYYINNNAIYFLTSKKTSQKDDTATKYICSVTIHKYDFQKESSTEIVLEDIVMPSNWYNYTGCFGVDNTERVYLTSHDDKLRLFNEKGTYLSETSTDDTITQFCGFDSVNGNFYYMSSYNWVYWGYNHDMASMMAGNVDKSNVIQVKDTNMMMLYQDGFYDHQNPIAMLNGRYLAALSTFNSNIGILMDSNAYDYTDVTKQSTSINLISNKLSVSVINIANKDAIKMAFQTASSKYENNKDISSIGTRCALNADETSLIVKTDSNVLTEYDMKTQTEKIRLQTKHPVYTFDMKGEHCIAVERDGDDFYLENIDWVYPTDIEVDYPNSMTVGSSGKISCTADNDAFKLDYTYESSDPSVVSVDKKGKLNAFKAGTVTITIKASPINITKQIRITVKDTEISGGNDIYKTSDITELTSEITHSNTNRSYYGSPQTAYLTPLENGNYERVEYLNKKIVREIYDSSFKLQSTSEIPFELSIWGGYFSGKNYNFLVFGEQNPNESDEQEVYRIVQYDKNWKRLGACSIKGANTYVPFEAGGADLTETNGRLYLHTCHTMYKSSDGYHHQANCTFVMNESNLEIVDSFYDVMNLSSGYVSHSFSQKIATDGSYIYRADLGDAYPRGIAFTATDINDKIDQPSIYGSVINIPGETGANYTGFTLDALKVSEDYYMVAGTGIKAKGDSVKNIYINCGLKDNPDTGATWITNYTGTDNVQVLCPKLVSINKTQFLLMWEEKNTKTEAYETKMVLLNEDGRKVSDIYSSKLALSKCDPIVNKKGMVTWYVTKEDSPIFVELNPYQLSKVATATKDLTIFHKHKWDKGNLTKEATCTEDGEKTYTCSVCQNTKVEKIPALGHNWKDNRDGTATCQREGCGKKHSHKWDKEEITKKASCTEPGEKIYTCSICENTKTEEIPATGHTLEKISIIPPTCTSAGVITSQCKECKTIIKTEDSEHPALGHDWKNEDGKCTRCGEKHAHKWDKENITKEATCTEDGEKTYTCSVCQNTKTEKIPATGHNWKNVSVEGISETQCQCTKCNITKPHELEEISTTQPTCTSAGIITSQCKDCKAVVKKEDSEHPALGHTWGEWIVTRESTCIVKGEKTRYCSNCGETEVEEIPLADHSLQTVNKKPATCAQEGYTGNQECSICHEILERGKVLPKLAKHTWNKGVITKQSTYKTNGMKTYTCTVCKAKRTEKLPVKPLPPTGTTYTVSGNTYKVKKAGKEVSFMKASTVAKSLTIPKTITAQGITYKVTSIEAKAFKNNKKIKTVTIGENITKIANNAFYKCPNLKTVKMNTVKLTKKTASQKAFAGTNKKMVIKAPKKVKNTYKKIFKGIQVK